MTSYEKEVIERLTKIESDIGNLHEYLNADFKVLHGNGQPGLVHRVTVLETNQKAKENHFGIVAGIIGFIINAAIAIYAALKNQP